VTPGFVLAVWSLCGWDAGSEAAALERPAMPVANTSADTSHPRERPAPSLEAPGAKDVSRMVASTGSAPVQVRVALQEGVGQVQVLLAGTFLVGGKPASDRTISVRRDGLDDLGLALEPDGSLLAVPLSPASSFRIGSRSYRGALRLRVLDHGLCVVNEVGLEDYLLGVVPGEIGRKLEPRLLEAVKAQAIVARTYATRALGQYGSKPWDLRDDVRDQMYEGRNGEDALCSRAVLETRGQILVDRAGKPIDAYYHSTSGGATADIGEVWPGKTVRPYLRGVDDTAPDGRAWGAYSPSAAWTETWPDKTLLAAVRRDLPAALAKPCDPGEVVSLDLSGHDSSGRARKLVVRGRKSTCEVVGDRIRWALKRPAAKGILRSARFSLEHSGNQYIARGTGNGHGVGLSQTGAIGRARAGQRCDSILTSYYPGTRLAQASETPGSSQP